MNIPDYLRSSGLSQAAFAASLGVSQGMVWQWIKGVRPVPPDRCLAIERASASAITRQDLRPQDYWTIWPDLPAPACDEASHA